ncbi:MAG: hypothetical protein M1365_12585 [Actinobacteria bacterium]|nr:hypothetical protein [Actinomycetota bacterium]
MLNSKNKGTAAENKAKNKFRSHNLKSFRMFRSGADPFFKGDVVLGFGPWTFNFESKHHARISIFRIWEKHKRIIPGSQIPGMILREDYSDILVAITIQDFCIMAETIEEYHELKRKLKNL